MFVLEGQKLKINEFIDSFAAGLRQARIKEAFEFAFSALPILESNFHSPRKPFLLEVERRDVINAQAISMESEALDKIIMSDGLVMHCIKTAPIPIDDVFTGRPPEDFDYNLPGQCTLAWALAHEATHLYRHHDRVEHINKRRIDSSALKQVLEMDADMLGVSCVFRLLQKKFQYRHSDHDVRRLTLYTIFWAIRTLYSTGGLETHLPIAPRLEQILSKVSTVDANPFLRQTKLTPEMIQRGKILSRCLARFEHLFQERGGDNINIANECKAYRDSGRQQALELLWIRISKDVERLSDSPAYTPRVHP